MTDGLVQTRVKERDSTQTRRNQPLTALTVNLTHQCLRKKNLTNLEITKTVGTRDARGGTEVKVGTGTMKRKTDGDIEVGVERKNTDDQTATETTAVVLVQVDTGMVRKKTISIGVGRRVGTVSTNATVDPVVGLKTIRNIANITEVLVEVLKDTVNHGVGVETETRGTVGDQTTTLKTIEDMTVRKVVKLKVGDGKREMTVSHLLATGVLLLPGRARRAGRPVRATGTGDPRRKRGTSMRTN